MTGNVSAIVSSLKKAHREHDLLMERTNVFLLYHSILMAGFAIGSNAPSIIRLLPGLGIIGSTLWIYIGHRSLRTTQYFRDRLLECEATMPEADRVMTAFFVWRRETKTPFIGFPIETYIAHVFPVVWALTWAAAAVFS
jgi:hypothetical protein